MFSLALLLLGTLFLLFLDLFLKGQKSFIFYAAEGLLVLTFSSLIFHLQDHFAHWFVYFGGTSFPLESFSALMQGACIILVFFIFGYSKGRPELEGRMSEFIFLMLFSLAGALVVVSAQTLLTLYLGLELLSLPLYALIALERDRSLCAEAAMKYFVMGALASAFLLFGFSLLYGLTGHLDLASLGNDFSNISDYPAFSVALLMILSALAFKLAIVPFHLWISDVYEGAPLPVMAYLASLPKLAVIVLFIRVISPYVTSSVILEEAVLGLGVLSFVVGHCAAWVQISLRKLVAYSTVGNMGLVWIAFSLSGHEAALSAFFYAGVYIFSALALLGLLLSFQDKIETIDDLKGLYQIRPYWAFLFLLVILSLIGLPPLLGFDAKFLVLTVLIHQNHLILAILVLVFSVLSAAYYLKIVRAIYFENQAQAHFKNRSGFAGFCVNVNAWGLLILGILPQSLMLWIDQILPVS